MQPPHQFLGVAALLQVVERLVRRLQVCVFVLRELPDEGLKLEQSGGILPRLLLVERVFVESELLSVFGIRGDGGPLHLGDELVEWVVGRGGVHEGRSQVHSHPIDLAVRYPPPITVSALNYYVADLFFV